MPIPKYLRTRHARLIGLVGLFGAVAVGGLYGIHQWNLAKTAVGLLDDAREARSEGRLKEAVSLYDQYFGMRPKDVEPKPEFALLLDKVAKTPRGRKRVFLTYDESLRQFPERDDLRRRLVDVALEIGRLPDAAEHLAKLNEAGVDDAWYWLQTARLNDATTRYAQAADACEAALRRDSSLLDASELLARLYHTRLDRTEDAERVLDLMASRSPKDPDVWTARARLRLEFRQPRRALDDLNKAFQLAPGQEDVLLSSGRCVLTLLHEGQDVADLKALAATGRKRLERGAELFPQNVEFPLVLSELEDALGRPAAALEALKSGLKSSPDDLQLKGRLAELLIAQSAFEDAEKLTASMEDGPFAKALNRYLDGRRQMAAGDWLAARQTLDAAAQEAAPFPQLFHHIALHQAECFRHLDQVEQEAAAYRRVLRADPASERARLGLASIAVREKRWNDAIAEYRELQHVPKAPEALARALLQRNEDLPTEARDWREFDVLLSRMRRDSANKTVVAELTATATAVRNAPATARHVASAPPTFTATSSADTPAAPAVSTKETSTISARLRVLVSSDRAKDALDLWKKSLRTSNPQQHLELTTDLVEAQLEQRDAISPAEPIEWLRRHDPKSFGTARLAARWLVTSNRADEAARVLDAATTGAAGDNVARQIGVLTLAWMLVDEAGRVAEASPQTSIRTESTQRDATIGLSRLGERLGRKHLTEKPENLLILTSWLSMKDQSERRWTFEPSEWADCVGSIRANPALVIHWTPQLSPAMTARVEGTISAAIQANLARLPLSVGLGDFEALLGRPQVAEQWYRAALRIEPNHVQTLNNLAWMTALRGSSLDEARGFIDRAISVAGNEARLIDTRGCVLLARKDAAAALRDFETSLRMHPGPMVAFHLARARAARGDAKGAAEAMRTILDEGHTGEDFHPLERPSFEELKLRLKL